MESFALEGEFLAKVVSYGHEEIWVGPFGRLESGSATPLAPDLLERTRPG